MITHRIDYGASKIEPGSILYADFTVQHNLTEFSKVFQVPDECQNAMRCPDTLSNQSDAPESTRSEALETTLTTEADAPGSFCNARSMIANHEGKRKCVYKDSRGIPTIGIGYNLNNPGARAALAAVGANYDSIMSGASCLTDAQVMELFEPSYQSAVAGAKVPCCLNSALTSSAHGCTVVRGSALFPLSTPSAAMWRRS